MSNSPTTSVPEDIDKALDNLIDWIMGHDDEELANIDFRKAKREVLTTVESYGDRRGLEGRIDEIEETVTKPLAGKSWLNIRPDAEIVRIYSRIAHLKKELEALNGKPEIR